MLIDITNFGGLYPAQQDETIPLHMATRAVDVDLSNGTIRPFKTDLKVSDKTGNVIWSDDCCFLTFDDCNTSICQEDISCKYVFVAGNGAPKYATYEDACNGVWCDLTYDCSFPAPTLSNISAVNKNFTYELVSFVYTFVNKYGEETTPSFPASISISNNNMVAVSGIPMSNTTNCWSKVRIYASRSGYQTPNQKEQMTATGFYLLAELDYPNSSAVVQYGSPGHALSTFESDPLPRQAWDISHQRTGHLSAIVDNRLRFSERRQWLSWPEESALAIPGTAIRHLAGQDWSYVLTDERPLAVMLAKDCKDKRCHSVKEIQDTLPIIAPQSASMYNDAVVYASINGLVMLIGGQHKVVSKPWFDRTAWEAIMPDTMIGIVHEGHYFGWTDNYAFRLQLPSMAFNDEKQDASLINLSIPKPKALYETRDGILLMAFDDGIYHWNNGDDFKPYIWERKHWLIPSITGMSAWKVDFEYAPPSKITHWRNSAEAQVKAPADKKDYYRLPICKSTKWGVTIEGVSEIRRYRIATSPRDLIRNG